MSYNEKYMRRAIELAKMGTGRVNPNPLVGAVIVKDGRIIAEGYHARYGELHAERAAFAALKESAEGAEMYVTLEPCCHFGKQPPCTHAIVEHKISKVYVGSDDPNDKVAGKGIEYLREHNIEVVTHVLKEECDAINSVFFKYITTKLPYVTMKYAMTMDGKIATRTGKSKWITGEKSRENVQNTRNSLMGIMVGIGTVLKDNPMLTCRIANGRNPIRIVCDTKLRIPLDSNIVKTADKVKTIVAYVEDIAAKEPYAEAKKNKLLNASVNILPVSAKNNKIDLRELMILLGKEGIDGILLEGGANLNYSALEASIVDEVMVYVAPKIFGGIDALSPVEGIGVDEPSASVEFEISSTEIIDNDILITYKKKQ